MPCCSGSVFRIRSSAICFCIMFFQVFITGKAVIVSSSITAWVMTIFRHYGFRGKRRRYGIHAFSSDFLRVINSAHQIASPPFTFDAEVWCSLCAFSSETRRAFSARFPRRESLPLLFLCLSANCSASSKMCSRLSK